MNMKNHIMLCATIILQDLLLQFDTSNAWWKLYNCMFDLISSPHSDPDEALEIARSVICSYCKTPNQYYDPPAVDDLSEEDLADFVLTFLESNKIDRSRLQ